MNLYLVGHDYKYAAEQMLVTLFPGQRPVYPAAPPDPGDPSATLTLFCGESFATAKTRLFYDGKGYTATARIRTAGLVGQVLRDRALQKVLKLSFYRAGTQALGREPPWGSITGVRPVKIPTKAMLGGASAARAEGQLRDVYHVSPMRRALAMDCARASLAARETLRPDEISLYIGIPFCPTRCAYCSFVSADVGRSLALVTPYLQALFQEIAAAGSAIRRAGLCVRTVYIGGGTPTTLSAPQLTALMEEVGQRIDLSRCTEYTVEAGRPDTITPEKLSAIRAGGGGRVSVNPQTMHDAVLRAMGRAHSAADILSALPLVKAAGIPGVNMDLIAGLPEDSLGGFCASLDAVADMAPENITVHTLALKKGSRLIREGGNLPPPECVCAMLDYACTTLRDRGYAPYYLYRQKYMSGSFENVGWTRPGCESLYNICMMEELHTVLALGGGGVTKLVNPKTGYIERLANPKYPHEYMANMERLAAEKEKLTAFYAAMERS